MPVRWTRNAANDLTRIVERIQANGRASKRSARKASKIIAKRVVRKMYTAIGELSKFPQRGRIGLVSNTRELSLLPWPYIAVYEILQEQVHVLRIRHTSQDWP